MQYQEKHASQTLNWNFALQEILFKTAIAYQTRSVMQMCGSGKQAQRISQTALDLRVFYSHRYQHRHSRRNQQPIEQVTSCVAHLRYD